MATKLRMLEYCGAFNGTIKMRRGETPEQALERVEQAIQRAVDAPASVGRDCNIGVDHGDYTVTEEA